MGTFDIITVGTDTSGRPVKMTRRMKAAYDEVCQRAGVTPTIVQGAFMGTGGAAASAGTHSQSGCLDTRTWDLTATQRDDVIRAARVIGWAVWYRTAAQGFDPHCHWVLPGEQPMHPDAAAQVDMYRRGLNGLASGARDDFWRPSPLPAYTYNPTPPPPEEDDMADYADQLTTIEKTVKRIDTQMSRSLEQSRTQTARILAELADKPDGRLTRADVREASERAYQKAAAEQKESA